MKLKVIKRELSSDVSHYEAFNNEKTKETYDITFYHKGKKKKAADKEVIKAFQRAWVDQGLINDMDDLEVTIIEKP